MPQPRQPDAPSLKPESFLARILVPARPSRARLSVTAAILAVWIAFLLGLYFVTIASHKAAPESPQRGYGGAGGPGIMAGL